MTQNQETFQKLRDYINAQIIGQPTLVDRLLIALLSDGHLLVEGAPGLAKTKVVKTLSNAIDAIAHRIQFTPDLLPGDITGLTIYDQKKGEFVLRKGPAFTNVLLADEIYRATPRTQSGLL